MFKTRSISYCLLLFILAIFAVNHMTEGQLVIKILSRFRKYSLIIFCKSRLQYLIFLAARRTCPENEFYTDCGNSCQTLCSTLNKPCLIRHIRCPDGCYCNEGYARDANRKCIPISECPKEQIFEKNMNEIKYYRYG